jgi:hypothetical protein
MRLMYGMAVPILMIVGLIIVLALHPATWLATAVVVVEIAVATRAAARTRGTRKRALRCRGRHDAGGACRVALRSADPGGIRARRQSHAWLGPRKRAPHSGWRDPGPLRASCHGCICTSRGRDPGMAANRTAPASAS